MSNRVTQFEAAVAAFPNQSPDRGRLIERPNAGPAVFRVCKVDFVVLPVKHGVNALQEVGAQDGLVSQVCR